MKKQLLGTALLAMFVLGAKAQVFNKKIKINAIQVSFAGIAENDKQYSSLQPFEKEYFPNESSGIIPYKLSKGIMSTDLQLNNSFSGAGTEIKLIFNNNKGAFFHTAKLGYYAIKKQAGFTYAAYDNFAPVDTFSYTSISYDINADLFSLGYSIGAKTKPIAKFLVLHSSVNADVNFITNLKASTTFYLQYAYTQDNNGKIEFLSSINSNANGGSSDRTIAVLNLGVNAGVDIQLFENVSLNTELYYGINTLSMNQNAESKLVGKLLTGLKFKF